MQKLEAIRSVAGTVSRETLERIEQFEKEFRRWNARINLAAASTLDDMWERHILDSAQLLGLSAAQRWLDLGSGGGFPGAIAGILLRERQGASIDLVESNRKKAAFLASTLGSLGAPARVHAVRIEEAPAIVGAVDVVTARALAPLPDLLRLSRPWLSAGARGLFHKGRDYAQEVRDSRNAWSFDLVEHRSRIDSAGRILAIGNLAAATRGS